MKKLVSLALIVVLSITYLNAQSVYYDALYLKDHFNNNVFTTAKGFNKAEDSLRSLDAKLQSRAKELQNSNLLGKDDSVKAINDQRKALVEPLKKVMGEKDDSLFSVLKKYFPEIKENDGSSDISTVIKKNPFYTEYSVKGSVKGGANQFFNLGLSNIISSVGGLDVTKYANAIADLMIERAKQELTIAFFNRFKKFADDHPEFKTLFPKTTDNLGNLLSYTYPQMLPKLRDGFFDDIKQLTYNLEAFLELSRYKALWDKFPEIPIAAHSLKLVHELENGHQSVDTIITQFAGFSEWTNPNGSNAFKNTAASVKFAAILSESLRYNDDAKRIWISLADAKQLITDEVFTNIYLGLLYQQIENSSFNLVYYFDSKKTTNTVELKKLLADQKTNILLMQNKIAQFLSLAEKVDNAYGTIKEKSSSGEKNTNDDYFNYISVSIDVVDFSFGFVKIFNDNFKSDNYITIAKKSNSLYKNIYTKQYTLAVSDAMDILKNIDTLIEVKDASGDIKDAFAKYSAFVNKLEPYAIFMGNMIEAKDENEVKAALENVVLPVGSSAIKKNTSGWWGNIAIQSYLGAFGVLSSTSSTTQSTWTDKFGITAPIGVAWTPGILSWRRGGSLTVFASLFDIGAIVDYKLKQDSTIAEDGSTQPVVSKDYKIQLGQILSPGGYLVYGFAWNLPLSLGIGAQYGPGLSKIDAGGHTVVTNPSWRWNAFLAVDLPLFNIKNKSNVKVGK